MTEYSAPLIEDNGGWSCSIRCRVGSAACAQAVGLLGTNPDVNTLNEATSTIMAFNNCQGPSLNGEMDFVCEVANAPVEAAEVWV